MGRVNLVAFFGRDSLVRQGVYAATCLTSGDERTVDFAVESDDDVELWLNGTLVHRHATTRAVFMEADTVTLRLAGGRNQLLYKVLNRGGGFGFGGRILRSGPDPVGDVAVTACTAGRGAAAPAPHLTLGPVDVPSRAVLDSAAGGTLVVRLRAAATRWGSSSAAATASIGEFGTAVPSALVGLPVPLEFAVPWATLARVLRAEAARFSTSIGGGGAGHRAVPGLRDALLDQLSHPIALDMWHRDSAAGLLSAEFAVPAPLAGLTLVLEGAEFSRTATISIGGDVRSADSAGIVPLCTSCAAGRRIRIDIAAHGAPWWDAPSIRVAEPGWREIREGGRWARRLAPALLAAGPGAAVADTLLAGALHPSKRAYHAAVADWMARLAPAAAQIRRDTIDIVGNSHLDVVWLWNLAEGVDVLRNTWRTATKLLAKYPRMHFAASSAYYYALLERDDPALLRAIQALVKEGRWNLVGGWWVEPDANLPSGESLVRQGLYGQRTLRRLFGRTARIGWTPDTFGYAWTLPQILLGSGLDGFVTQKLRWNDHNPWAPGLDAFTWVGPDGSRVLTYIPYGYDHDLDPDRLAAELDSTVSGGRMRDMLVLYGVGDHGGGPTMDMLDRARDLSRVPTFPALHDASPEDALARIRRDLGTGPEVRDELYLEYHRGVFTTNGAMKWWNRRVEGALAAAEAAAAIAPTTYPREELTRAWTLTLFNQMHDILPGTSIRAVHAQAELDYATADSLARAVLERSVRDRLAATDTRAPEAGWRSFAAFNPSSEPRAGRVRVRIPGAGRFAAFDRSSRPLPAQAVGSDTLEVLAPVIPPLGTMRFSVGPAAGAAAPEPAGTSRGAAVLESALLRVEIDSLTGDIARMVDRQTGREVLGAGSNRLMMLEDRPGRWDAWNINHLNGRRTPIDRHVVIGPVVRGVDQSITVTRERDSVRVVQRYVLPADAARLDVETTVEWHTRHELLKVAFVLPFHADSIAAEIPYGVILRPTIPRNSVDSARFEVPMQRWVDASIGGRGVAIVNDSRYGYDARGDTVRLSLLRSPLIPDAISDQRTHHFVYSVVPHEGDWRAPDVRRAAEALNAPLVGVLLDQHDGASAAPPAPLTVDIPGAVVGALKRAEGGDGLVVRVVESRGAAVDGVIRLAVPSVARETNLLEDPEGTATGAVSEFPVHLAPWQIRTYLITPR